MPTLADKYLYKGLSGETYPDRKAGAKEGIYEIEDLSLTQYLVPQECGMRMDTEWLEITRHTALDNSRTDSSSQTLRIEKKDEKFAFSCLPYTASEIENALHHEELPPARRTVLCIYGAVRGVGGIDSWGTDCKRIILISLRTDTIILFHISSPAGQIARHRHCALKRMMKNLHFLSASYHIPAEQDIV